MTANGDAFDTNSNGSAALLRMQGLTKTFRRGNLWRKEKSVNAIRDVNLEIRAGSTLAIAGVSGSGKSTLAICMAQLETADAGDIWYKNQNLKNFSRAEMALLRKKIQLIFQDSASALNPRLRAIEIVSEPLEISKLGSKQQRREVAFECMRLAGLGSELAERRPLQLSGGQRQRLTIARALTLSPEVLIFDESFSGLDLVLEAQILEMLEALKSSNGLTYVVITHDLSLVAGFADYVAVMQSGGIVEHGPTGGIFTQPQHEQTRTLLAAMPRWAAARAAGSGA